MLLQHGITPTQQRLTIARLLFAKPQHLSADQVLAMIQATSRAAVSKATVYNTLHLFASKGLVREINVDSSRVFYDSNTTVHHHIYNTDSGELSDIGQDEIRIDGQPKLPKGLVATSIDVIVRVRSE